MVTTNTIKRERFAEKQRLASKYKKELRKKATPQEKKVHAILKVHFPSVQFQKSFLTGPSIIIVDFFIPRRGVVIEIDGNHHYNGEQAFKDRQRDAYLRKRGFKVIRVKNREIDTIDFKTLVETAKRKPDAQTQPKG